MTVPHASSRSGARSLRAIFATPLALAVVTLAGLIAGLAGDGWLDVVAWIGLAAPVVAMGWYTCRPRADGGRAEARR